MSHTTEPREGSPEATRLLRELQRVTDSALSYLTLDDLLAELLDRVTEILSSDTAAFLELDERNEVLAARAAKGIEEEVAKGVRIPVGRGFAGRVAAERRPVAIEDVDHADILNPILREKGIRSLLGVPMIVEGRVIGVLHVGTLAPRDFGEADAELLQLVADRAGLAIVHARVSQEQRVVAGLQQSLLPEPLPDVPGLELAARYLPASMTARVGGDWYDVFSVGSGRFGLVVGDVMGRGVGAAMQMAQLRTALRAYAFDGHPPVAVAERLNRLWHPARPVSMTTLAYLVLDVDEESVTMVSAGHVPPLVIDPDGETRFLDVEGDPPLGVSRATAYHERTFAFPAGSTVVLVSDGAVEVRGERLDVGLERLAALARRRRDPAGLCTEIAAGAARNGHAQDDLAILVTHLAPLPDHLHTSWPAEAEVLADVRGVLRRWLRRWTGETGVAYDVRVAVQEACSNAVEHAYASGPARFELDARHRAGVVTVSVRDHGRWRSPRGKHRGRGLPLMRALMDTVEVDHAEDGTTVRMSLALEGRA